MRALIDCCPSRGEAVAESSRTRSRRRVLEDAALPEASQSTAARAAFDAARGKKVTGPVAETGLNKQSKKHPQMHSLWFQVVLIIADGMIVY